MPRHTCHAQGCARTCPRQHLMCARHWGMVPARHRRAVLAAYTPGQCGLSPSPAEAWHRAADKAILAVAIKEGLISPDQAFQQIERKEEFYQRVGTRAQRRQRCL